jgi:hypothetical protein
MTWRWVLVSVILATSVAGCARTDALSAPGSSAPTTRHCHWVTHRISTLSQEPSPDAIAKTFVWPGLQRGLVQHGLTPLAAAGVVNGLNDSRPWPALSALVRSDAHAALIVQAESVAADDTAYFGFKRHDVRELDAGVHELVTLANRFNKAIVHALAEGIKTNPWARPTLVRLTNLGGGMVAISLAPSATSESTRICD